MCYLHHHHICTGCTALTIVTICHLHGKLALQEVHLLMHILVHPSVLPITTCPCLTGDQSRNRVPAGQQ
jgi:hypothetical protein